jgi:tetratricopeptide (TPR) repeat protein
MRSWITSLTLLLLATSPASLLCIHGQERSAQSNTLADKAGRARTILGETKAAALGIKYDYQRGLVLDEIGEAEAKAGDLNGALDTADRAYPHNMATLTAVGEQLGDSADTSQAQSAVQKLKGGGASTVYAFMSQRLAARGKIAHALETTGLIEVPEVRRDALEWIARRQAAGGDYAGARRTLASARAASPNRRSNPDGVEMLIIEGHLSRGEAQAARAEIASLRSAEARSAALMGGAEELRKRGEAEGAAAWLEEGLRLLPAGPGRDFFIYLAIPLQVKLAQKERAMLSAGGLPSAMRLKGYAAVAVTCAEMKDIACADAALERMRSTADTGGEDKEQSQFGLRLMTLNVTAALIDNGQLEAASRILTDVGQHQDDMSSKMAVEPEVMLQHVLIRAQQGQFEEARSLALKMRPDSVADLKRGKALRTLALLQARKDGAITTRRWASALTDATDRAEALLGIAQAQLGIGDVKLSYNAVQIH